MKNMKLIIISSMIFIWIQCMPDAKKNNWVFLFNGTDLQGFEMIEGKGDWFVENGVIVGNSLLENPSSYLCTTSNYDNFILELDFKCDPGINSGVQIRSTVHQKDTTITYLTGKLEKQDRMFKKGSAYGYQVEIDPSERAWNGGLYESNGRGWLVTLQDNERARNAYHKEDWNHFRIKVVGDSIITSINGVKAVSTTDSLFKSGSIGFQLHKIYRDEQKGKKIYFKNMKIKKM